MKKIIALALALVLALSLGSVAFAAPTDVDADGKAPGNKVTIKENVTRSEWKISYDFTKTGTTAADSYKGASLVEKVAFEKQTDGSYDVVLTLKESLTTTDEKDILGLVTLTSKVEGTDDETYLVAGTIKNTVDLVDGGRKTSEADKITEFMKVDHVMFAEDAPGYAEFTVGYSLKGMVKFAKDEKAQVYVEDYDTTEKNDEDLVDAVDAYLGDDYDGIVEWYNFCGTGFKADVDFQYDAYEDDPHFFYLWDGEKFVDLKAKYDDDEDVDDYVFTAPAKGLIIVTDTEIVAAAEEEATKNPDTGANDVVGVAAALAVVSLVAAGAVALKK